MLKKFISLILLQQVLNGCAGILPLSVAGAAVFVSDERSVGKMIDDKMISSKINSDFAQKANGHMFLSITVNVLEGRVMLTGSVASRECIDDAVKTAWSTKGVREVINELKVELKSMKHSANDTLIEKAIDGRLLIEKKLISTNYKISVNNNVVYILGIAQNQNEMDRALYIARNAKGVEKVINYIILKTDIRRGVN